MHQVDASPYSVSIRNVYRKPPKPNAPGMTVHARFDCGYFVRLSRFLAMGKVPRLTLRTFGRFLLMSSKLNNFQNLMDYACPLFQERVVRVLA